jgi:hypothetical protein
MAIPVLPLALIVPLVIAVVDKVPTFNTEATCRGGMGSPGLDERYGRCMKEEADARTTLEGQWTQFPAGDRSTCSQTARIGAPSYVELLTCLQMQADARKLPKN